MQTTRNQRLHPAMLLTNTPRYLQSLFDISFEQDFSVWICGFPDLGVEGEGGELCDTLGFFFFEVSKLRY